MVIVFFYYQSELNVNQSLEFGKNDPNKQTNIQTNKSWASIHAKAKYFPRSDL